MDPVTGEVAETVKFHPGQLYDMEPGLLGLEMGGRRSTSLGTSIYSRREGVEARAVEAVRKELAEGGGGGRCREEGGGDLAREELNLLAKLIGTETDFTKKTFRLSLFDGEPGEEEAEEEVIRKTDGQTLEIDLKCGRGRGDLERIITEMTVSEEEGEEEDLLALMDQAV